MGSLTIVVCVKVSPDTAQLRADPHTGAPRLSEAPRRISTFDENALEEAVRLKGDHGGKIVALSLVAEDPPPEITIEGFKSVGPYLLPVPGNRAHSERFRAFLNQGFLLSPVETIPSIVPVEISDGERVRLGRAASIALQSEA